MMNPEILPIPPLRELFREPERMNERAGLIRLDRNERLSPFPPQVFAEMMKVITPELICTYPDPTPLYGRISRSTGLPEDCFFFTNGSDAALRLIVQAFIQPGDKLVLSDPSYAMLGVYAKITQANVRLIPYDLNIRLDVGRVEELLREGPKVLALPNPDQPTGTVLAPSRLRQIVELAHSYGTLVVIDEAYHPFYRESAIAWVKEYANLIVTRSFSKAWGLSGLRLGVMAGQPKLVDYASRLRGLHEVNTVAVAMGCYLLDHPQIVEDYVDEVASGREVLKRGAQELGLGFPECHTNFQLMRLLRGEDSKRILESMKERGFLIKGAFRSPAIRDCIRATVGPATLMKHFIAVLANVLETERKKS
jgi:histidinol-phosphate aminotransferase